ncbi:hypothetical protein LVJ94_23825 [Pendulispora rubella]|uniref:Uncharacterized protein n=1 Tax=Pendulispora rubella TaxID=2741070 RepID=A0ABZ2LM69_9BACT
MHANRCIVVFAIVSAWSAGAWLAACSSSDSNEPADAGSDATVDGALDGGRDSGPRGHCSAVQGPACDLVLQDCPEGQQCIVQDTDAGYVTACVAAGTGNRPAGASCCPGRANQCAAGLECIGAACAGDAATARCTPHCCQDDDGVCGSSVPEGFPGACEILVYPNEDSGVGRTPLYHVCSYKPACKPFRIQTCGVGQTCLLQRDGTSYRCNDIVQPPGKAVGQTCSFANHCADGLACLGPPDAGVCRTLCYHRGGEAPPFDASAVRDEPGYGGCQAGSACTGTVTGFPGYLGYCL